VIPAVIPLLKPQGKILALIKPQFEVGKGKVGKGGVVKDPELHSEICRSLTQFFKQQGLRCGPMIPSPILGTKGNQEFIILLSRTDSVL
jgi:23S rRNA (cytidine1920-2'-O)/16S rRNA (cytidine1409-2'-O)-methyltransferase